MEITIETARNVAKLANLALSEAELAQIAPQLTQILNLAGELNALNLDAVEVPEGQFNPVLPVITASAQTVACQTGQQAFRPDVPHTPISREDLLKNAPQQEDGAFVVPNIL